MWGIVIYLLSQIMFTSQIFENEIFLNRLLQNLSNFEGSQVVNPSYENIGIEQLRIVGLSNNGFDLVAKQIYSQFTLKLWA